MKKSCKDGKGGNANPSKTQENIMYWPLLGLNILLNIPCQVISLAVEKEGRNKQ